MEHTDIAPLAKRLAEENNVDWRRLSGSGEQGRVVERDVLEYLARVMAGDEDLDPTPEPVPDGMEAWPDEDVRAFEHENRGEVPPSPTGVSTVDDEIFLLEGDDEAEPLGGHEGPYAGGRGTDAPHPETTIDDDFDEDDLLVAGDDDGQPLETYDALDTGDSRAAAAPDAGERLSYEPPSGQRDELPDLFGEAPARSRPADPPVFGDESGDGRRGLGYVADPADGAEPSIADAARDGGDPGAATNDAPVAASDDPMFGDVDFGGVAPAAGPSFEETALEVDRRVAAGPSLDLDDEHGGAEDSPVAAEESAVVVGDGAGDDHEGTGRPPPAPTAPADAGAPLATRQADRGVASLPLVSHGAVWRRQVDLTNLVAAQADVARGLGLDEPVPVLAFLVRAAAKALDDGSTVAVAVFDEEAMRTQPLDALTTSFADVVESLADDSRASLGGDDAGEAALVVVDLSDLELDEAVLHLGAPVLALGRVLVDTSTGGRRATLSLSGDALGEGAARLLARTAELLETPIRVVL